MVDILQARAAVHRMRLVARAAASLLMAMLAAWALPAYSDPAYPAKSVKLLVAYPPGGTNDILARLVAERLTEALGQTFVVQNKSGANGVLGTDEVAKASPDGYTLLVASSAPTTVGATLLPNLPYDVRTDFDPVSLIAKVDVVLVANPNFPADTFPELLAWARANPGKLKVALGGYGSVAHMLIEAIRLREDIQSLVIPYKGTGPALVDLLSGTVDVDYENLPATIGYIRSNRLKPLVSFGKERTTLLPDVPSVGELGYDDLAAAPWFALFAPAGTPAAIQQKLAETLAAVLGNEEVRQRFADIGAHVQTSTPAQTKTFVLQEHARWAQLIQQAGIKMP